MTEEQLLREAKLYGAEAPEELTYGELAELLELGAERERRFLQGLALVAYRHAALTARALAGRELPPDDGTSRRQAGRRGGQQWQTIRPWSGPRRS